MPDAVRRANALKSTVRSRVEHVFAEQKGRVPRFAHWRTIPFFWPIRASSWNQISIAFLLGTPAKCAFSVASKFF
jgi:hypothetical protein